jgi:hypothetical protein
LRLLIRGVQGINRNYPIRLVRKEARGVVNVDDCGSSEDALRTIGWKECYLLVLPVVKVTGGSMPPMLIPGYRISRVVWEGQ